MRKLSQPLLAVLTVTALALACALPVPTFPPAVTPVPGGASPTPRYSPGDLETAVAATLTALMPGPGPEEATSTFTPTAPSVETPATGGVLPRTLYYLAPDSAGLYQVFRMEKDGTAQRAVTSESETVSDYDVSLADGRVAYVVGNQLLLVNADGSERRVLVDGGTVDPNNPFITTLHSPVFSPDGATLAYGYKGLQLYSFASGESRLVIENQVDDVGGGLFVPRELYEPERYSPDGKKLLVTLGYYEGASSAIYEPASNSLVRLEGGEGGLICCDDTEWAFDSSSVYAASPTLGMFQPGLWRVDASTGQVTTLIPGDAGIPNYNLVDEAYLAPDGQLYYFFITTTAPEGIITRAALQLVRSGPDGVTGRVVLSSGYFEQMNEALWAPDASFVIVVTAPSPEIYQGGQAKIVYLDGRPGLDLLPSAQRMKWGP